MGIFDALAGAAVSGIGGAGTALQTKTLEDMKQEAITARENAVATHTSELADARQRGEESRRPGVLAAVQAAGTEQTLKDAPRVQAQRVADWLAVAKAQSTYENDPTNVTAKANAEALKAKIMQTSAADNLATLMKDPSYTKNIRELALAQNPEKAAQIAASMASAAKSNYDLLQAGVLGTAKDDYAAAVKRGDTGAIAKGAKTIDALERSVQSVRAEQASYATMVQAVQREMKSKQDTINLLATKVTMDPGDAVIKTTAQTELANLTTQYHAYLDKYNEISGVKTDAAPTPPGKTGWDSTTGDVYQNGAKIGSAKTAAEASGMIYKPVAAPQTGGGTGSWGASPTGLLSSQVPR